MFKSVQRVVMNENSNWALLWEQVRRFVNYLAEAIVSRRCETHVFGRWKVAAARLRRLRRSLQRAFLSD